MGLTPQQKDAISIRDKTLLVSAAAGSGKTRVLTDRIILSLLGKKLPDEELDSPNTPNDLPPADLSRMLIVTYTRAAAAELKERIAKALNEALSKNPENEHLSKQLFLLGSAQISTIDAFFQKAVKENFERLNIPSTFRIADENEMTTLKRERMERLLEEFYQRNTVSEGTVSSVKRFESNRFARALDHLISDRSDGAFIDNLLKLYSAFSEEPGGLEVLLKYADQMERDGTVNVFFTQWGEKLLERLEAPMKAYLAAFQTTAGAYGELDEKNRKRFENIFSNDLSLCESLTDALSRRSYGDAHFCVANASSVEYPSGGISAAAKAILSPYLSNRAAFTEDFALAKKWLAHSESDLAEQFTECADALRMLYEFFSEYKLRLDAEKMTRGTFEFPDIRAMLYGLLYDADGNRTPYAEELAKQYDVVYIDEYQDVDGIQDRIFQCVGENCRFMVGDIKQSIYGFRGSDPSIFADYRKAFPLYDRNDPSATRNDPNLCIFMSSNFRCNEPIIRFANKVCAFLFSACKDSIGYLPEDDLEFKKRMPEKLPEGHPAPVQLELFEGRPKGASIPADADGVPLIGTDETRWVAREIKRLLREEYLEEPRDKRKKANDSETSAHDRIIASDIAIIVRTHKIGNRFAQALAAYGIPAVASEQKELLHDPLLTSTVNLLRVIDNPYRDLPLMELLLSEFGGFTLTEVKKMRDDCDGNASLYDALLHARERSNEHAEHFLAWLDALCTTVAADSADQFLRRLYADEKVKPYATTPALLFLYDQARLAQKSAFCGLYEFLSILTKMLKDEDTKTGGFARAECAVQIVTVHHSKGLEFPVVFYVGLGSKFIDYDRPLLYHRKHGIALKHYNRKNGKQETPLCYHMVKDSISMEEKEEEIRNVYVSLTRARERLYVTGSLQGGAKRAIQNASAMSYGDRREILGVDKPLPWILATVGSEEDQTLLERHIHPYGSIPFKDENASSPSSDEETDEGASDEKATEGISAPVAKITEEYASIADRHTDFVYPDQPLTTLIPKIAASKICHDLLDLSQDEDDGRDFPDRSAKKAKKKAPTFKELLDTSENASAADRGTALHTFFEFCDFQAIKEHGIEAECNRLISQQLLTERAKNLLDINELCKLLSSDLLDMILSSADCEREKKFSILIPASELTENEELAKSLGDARIFVQGSIDMILTMPDGRKILIDYKTDRLNPEDLENPDSLREKFRRKHGNQLTCYARALQQIFGAAPDEARIYSVPLGSTVRIDLDGTFKNRE